MMIIVMVHDDFHLLFVSPCVFAGSCQSVQPCWGLAGDLPGAEAVLGKAVLLAGRQSDHRGPYQEEVGVPRKRQRSTAAPVVGVLLLLLLAG